LHTAHPFDFDKFTFVTSFQGGYNDLAGSFNPRAAALVSDTFLGGTVGVLVSAAYQIQNTLENGSSSVRWQNDNTAQNAAHSAPLIAGCVNNVPGATSQCAPGQRFRSVTVTSPLAGSDPTQVPGTVETVGSRPNGANFLATALP